MCDFLLNGRKIKFFTFTNDEFIWDLFILLKIL